MQINSNAHLKKIMLPHKRADTLEIIVDTTKPTSIVLRQGSTIILRKELPTGLAQQYQLPIVFPCTLELITEAAVPSPSGGCIPIPIPRARTVNNTQIERTFVQLINGKITYNTSLIVGSNRFQITGKPYESEMCVVCLETSSNIILLPCNHVCFCQGCFISTVNYICPLCREPIRGWNLFSANTSDPADQHVADSKGMNMI